TPCLSGPRHCTLRMVACLTQGCRGRFTEGIAIHDCKSTKIAEPVQSCDRRHACRYGFWSAQVVTCPQHPSKTIVRCRAHPQMLGAQMSQAPLGNLKHCTNIGQRVCDLFGLDQLLEATHYVL